MGNVSWEDTDGDNDYAEEDLDGNGVLSIDGDNNGDGYFLTAAPQRFVNSATYEPEKKSWLVWGIDRLRLLMRRPLYHGVLRFI